MAPRDRRALAGALLIVLLYMCASHLLSHFMGVPHYFNWDAWHQRFVVRSVILRLPAFFVCLALAWSLGGFKQWGWHMGRPLSAALLAAFGSVSFAALYFGRGQTAFFTPPQLMAGFLSVIPVALFEEACFRGLIFLSVREKFGAFGAALFSSVVFTVYHTAAVNSWAMIFMFGFIACACVHAGLGLPWLIVLHSLVDAAWFPMGTDVRLPVTRPWIYWGACAALYLCSVAASAMIKATAAATASTSLKGD